MKKFIAILIITLFSIHFSWASSTGSSASQGVALYNNITITTNAILEVKEIELNATDAATKDIFRQSVIVITDIDNNSEHGFNIKISDSDDTTNALLPSNGTILDLDGDSKNSVPVYFECHSLLFNLSLKTGLETDEEDTSGVYTYTTAVADGGSGAITTTNGGDAGVELEYHITSANFGASTTNGPTRWSGSGFNNTNHPNAFQGSSVSTPVEHYKLNVDTAPLISDSLVTDTSDSDGDSGINDSVNDSSDYCLNIDDPVEATKDAILFINMYIEQENAERMLNQATDHQDTFTISITSNS
jgi:hypothetical protein